jgi:hypothetical protein
MGGHDPLTACCGARNFGQGACQAAIELDEQGNEAGTSSEAPPSPRATEPLRAPCASRETAAREKLSAKQTLPTTV